MSAKYYVWGFPGVGKSSLRSSYRIVDADSNAFLFTGVSSSSLHQTADKEGNSRQKDYPQNYLDYIRRVDGDIIFINCHVSLLKELDRENLLLIYPSKELKGEYLRRYQARGDHPSFLQHMEESFEDMIDTLSNAPYRKLMLTDPKATLQSLLDGGILMSEFITKQELSNLLKESIRYGIYTPDSSISNKSPDALAQLIFEGEIDLDLSALRKDHAEAKAHEEQLQLFAARRGGLTHEELRDRIQEGIINGTFFIEHGQIAPYQYGYEVMYPNDRFSYENRWECYHCNFSQVAEQVTAMIESDRQSREVFSRTQLQPVDIQRMLSDIAEKEKRPLEAFTEAAQTKYEPRGRYTGHVATLKDVHQGLALDGIARGKFHGDYSSITTSSQNDLIKSLVFLKGFCLDCLAPKAVGQFSALDREDRAFILEHLKGKGIDITTPEKLAAWIRKNPEKCGLPENRNRMQSLDHKIDSAADRSTPKQADLPAPETEKDR